MEISSPLTAPKLLDQVGEKSASSIAVIRTQTQYLQWIKCFILF